MIGVAKRVQAHDLQLSCQVDHRAKRLGGIALPPGITSKHVTRARAFSALHNQAGASKQLSGRAREGEQRSCRPAPPLGLAESHKRLRIVDRGVTRPTHVARDLWIRGIALEDGSSITWHGCPEQQPRCLTKHVARHRERDPLSPLEWPLTCVHARTAPRRHVAHPLPDLPNTHSHRDRCACT